MANYEFDMLPVPDRNVIKAMEDLWQKHGSPGNASFTIALMTGNARHINAPMAQLANNQAVLVLREQPGIALRSFSLAMPEIHNFSLTLQRNPTLDHINLHLQDHLDPAITVQVAQSVREAFRPFDTAGAIDKALGPELSEFYRRREAGLLELEALAQRLIAQNTGYRAEMDLQLEQARGKLEAQLNHDREILNSQMQRREDDLAKREADLAGLRKELDDRNNTHARRQLREDLKKQLASRGGGFTLSPETEKKRRPIHFLFWFWMLVSGALAISEVNGLQATTITPSAVKFFASVISLLGATVTYLRWNDLWARQHAAEEFRMWRLALDVDRASWIVEVALEWKEERGGTIPPELLNRLTQNLFVLDGSEPQRAKHPVEDLSSVLLGASTALKLKLGEGELTLDRKGMRQLQKVANENGNHE